MPVITSFLHTNRPFSEEVLRYCLTKCHKLRVSSLKWHRDEFFPSSSDEEFAGWRSISVLFKERCCISLGIRFITARKQRSRANCVEDIPTPSSELSLINVWGHTHKHKERLVHKRHKANKSKGSWIGRQSGASRTVMQCDRSLLYTSKWCITGRLRVAARS